MATNEPRLTDADITAHLATLPGWQRDGNVIAKEFVRAGFSEATALAARVGPVADALDHHPDVQIYRYKRVKFILTTHSAGGLTARDFELAARIEELAAV